MKSDDVYLFPSQCASLQDNHLPLTGTCFMAAFGSRSRTNFKNSCLFSIGPHLGSSIGQRVCSNRCTFVIHSGNFQFKFKRKSYSMKITLTGQSLAADKCLCF